MTKILVVENLNLIKKIIQDLFKDRNEFKLYFVKNFEETKTLVKDNNFFASISNIVLEDALNGEILDYFKMNNIPTIVISSNMDKDTINLINKSGVVNYFSKDSVYALKSVYTLIKLLNYIKGKEVLVVDDSKLVLLQIKKSLETLLLKVHVAKNGLEALSVLDENPKISLLVTDHNMAKMSGLELIKKVRRDEHFLNIPILIMTTQTDNDLKISFYKNGATDFLLKPVLEEELKSKISAIFSSERQIENIKQFYKIVEEHVITSTADTNGIITKVSNAFCKISGYTKEELIRKPHNIVRHSDMPSSIFKELWNTIKSGKTWRGEVKNIRRDGSFYWVKAVIEPNFDSNGNIISYTSIREDITDKKRIYELSITDGLTSLYNRRYFNEVTDSLCKISIRNNDFFSFILLDIDNFKKYNDTYGHQKGDEALISVAKSLKKTFKRDEDLIFRLGGEEFGILLYSKSKDDILKVTELARKNIELIGIEHKNNLPFGVLTASFGLTITSDLDNIDIDEIYKKSDDSLYKAKENGRNKIELFQD